MPKRQTSLSSASARVLTAAVAAPAAVAAVLLLPSDLFFLASLVVFGAAAIEYARLVRHWAPSAPLGWLPVLVAATAVLVLVADRGGWGRLDVTTIAAAAAVLLVIVALVVLASKTRVPEAGIALGLIGFGIPYFVAPIVSVHRLQAADPWLLIALLLVVWCGDTAAYYVGSLFGRHKMAPVVSPKKTWEGAAAGLAASVLAVAAWSAWRLGEVRGDLLLVAALAGVTGQLGDLVESLIKRGVGVKDSSQLLPGHGGVYDRMDAAILAAPVFLLGLHWIGLGIASS